MLNRHRIMASGHDMCFWNWTLIFLLPEMFSSHTSFMCCLALAVFKSGWWSQIFLILRFWIYVTQKYFFKYDNKCNFKIILQCKASLLQTGHNFFPITFKFTIFIYLVRINVSFKDIWKRLSVCLKINGSLMCQNIDGSSIFLFSIVCPQAMRQN